MHSFRSMTRVMLLHHYYFPICMIDFSILQLSMTDGLVDGLVRVLGTLPMTLVCMLIMFTEGLRPGIRSFIAFAAGQGAFLLFLLLAPFWCINLWYTIEPGLAIFSLYCIGRVIHIYFNLSVFSLGFKFSFLGVVEQ